MRSHGVESQAKLRSPVGLRQPVCISVELEEVNKRNGREGLMSQDTTLLLCPRDRFAQTGIKPWDGDITGGGAAQCGILQARSGNGIFMSHITSKLPLEVALPIALRRQLSPVLGWLWHAWSWDSWGGSIGGTPLPPSYGWYQERIAVPALLLLHHWLETTNW